MPKHIVAIQFADAFDADNNETYLSNKFIKWAETVSGSFKLYGVYAPSEVAYLELHTYDEFVVVEARLRWREHFIDEKHRFPNVPPGHHRELRLVNQWGNRW